MQNAQFFLILSICIIMGYILILSSINASIPMEYEPAISNDISSNLRTGELAASPPQAPCPVVVPAASAPPKQEDALFKVASRPGVIVLGMHRSGTSVLGGLMNKMGLKTGGPLIQAGSDNVKGFFERIDVVLQNDYIMRAQNVHYSFNTHKYDAGKGLVSVLNADDKFFNEGKRGLAFLNNAVNYPWMLKDPRLCITMRTWLPLLNFIPAIVFTYRHPLDVALSMHNRETEHFPIGKAMRLWYVYNKRAIQQSNDLCRVVTSHRHVMSQPQEELDRVYTELREQCGVQVPHKVSHEDVVTFVDPKLQHGKTNLIDKSCEGGNDEVDTAVPPASSWETQDPIHLKLYRSSLRLYCAMEDFSAFLPDFLFDESIKND